MICNWKLKGHRSAKRKDNTEFCKHALELMFTEPVSDQLYTEPRSLTGCFTSSPDWCQRMINYGIPVFLIVSEPPSALLVQYLESSVTATESGIVSDLLYPGRAVSNVWADTSLPQFIDDAVPGA